MQSTTRFHDGVANAIFQEANLLLHHTIAFYPANGVFDMDAGGRDHPIGGFLQWGEFPSGGLFFGCTIVLPSHI